MARFAGHSPNSPAEYGRQSSSHLQGLFGTLVHGSRCADQQRGPMAAGPPRGERRSEEVSVSVEMATTGASPAERASDPPLNGFDPRASCWRS